MLRFGCFRADVQPLRDVHQPGNGEESGGAGAGGGEKNNWNMAVAVVDTDGNLVYFEKMDATQLASPNIAIQKARTATQFKRPTKALEDVVAAGGDGLRVLGLPGAVPVEGGIPLVSEGKIIGAIGVSGGASSQDAQCAKAGADQLK